MARKIIIIFALCVFQCHAAVENICTLDTLKLGNKEPLFLSEVSLEKYKFKIPVNGFLNFQQNEKLILACATDPKNQGTMNSFYCDNGNFKNSHDSTVANLQPFLQCDQSNNAYAMKTAITCLESNNFYQIGFLLNDLDIQRRASSDYNDEHYVNNFVELYAACLNPGDHTVAYVAHTLHGSSISRNQGIGMINPGKFSSQSIKNLDKFFLVKSQEKSLGKLFKIDFPRALYFARGHLSPFADGIFRSHREAANHMVNIVPQWQEINNGNYGAVEDKVKELAKDLGRDLYVISGGHGRFEKNGEALRLNNTDANSPRLPKLLYKIVVDKQTRSGIVFVVLNYNADTATNAEPPFCTDICVDSYPAKKRPATPKWNFPRKNEAAKGLVICCTVADFARKVTWSLRNRILLAEADQNNVLLPTS